MISNIWIVGLLTGGMLLGSSLHAMEVPAWVKHHVLGTAAWYMPKFCTGSLLDIGANPNVVDSKGRSLLIHAARYGDQETVNIMLEHQANVLIADHQGKTALHWAMGEKALTPADLAALNSRRTIVEQLIKKDPSLVYKEDHEGNTPLHYAACYGLTAVIEHLLQKDAEVNAVTKKGITPLMKAAYNTQENSLDIIKLLIKNGATVNLEDAQGWTAVLHAAKAGNQTVVAYLKSLAGNVPSK